jgi:hypothetical protein
VYKLKYTYGLKERINTILIYESLFWLGSTSDQIQLYRTPPFTAGLPNMTMSHDEPCMMTQNTSRIFGHKSNICDHSFQAPNHSDNSTIAIIIIFLTISSNTLSSQLTHAMLMADGEKRLAKVGDAAPQYTLYQTRIKLHCHSVALIPFFAIFITPSS